MSVENLSGPLKSSQTSSAGVDGVVGLGETVPQEISTHVAEGGTSTAKPGIETMNASIQGSAPTHIARRSPSHPLEDSSANKQ